MQESEATGLITVRASKGLSVEETIGLASGEKISSSPDGSEVNTAPMSRLLQLILILRLVALGAMEGGDGEM